MKTLFQNVLSVVLSEESPLILKRVSVSLVMDGFRFSSSIFSGLSSSNLIVLRASVHLVLIKLVSDCLLSNFC